MVIRNYLSELFTGIDAVHVFIISRRVAIFSSSKPAGDEKKKIEQAASKKLSLEAKCLDTVLSMTWGVDDIEKWNLSDEQRRELKAAYNSLVHVLKKCGIEYGTVQGPVASL